MNIKDLDAQANRDDDFRRYEMSKPMSAERSGPKPEAAIEDLLDLERGALTRVRFMQALSNAWVAGVEHAMRYIDGKATDSLEEARSQAEHYYLCMKELERRVAELEADLQETQPSPLHAAGGRTPPGAIPGTYIAETQRSSHSSETNEKEQP